MEIQHFGRTAAIFHLLRIQTKWDNNQNLYIIYDLKTLFVALRLFKSTNQQMLLKTTRVTHPERLNCFSAEFFIVTAHCSEHAQSCRVNVWPWFTSVTNKDLLSILSSQMVTFLPLLHVCVCVLLEERNCGCFPRTLHRREVWNWLKVCLRQGSIQTFCLHERVYMLICM